MLKIECLPILYELVNEGDNQRSIKMQKTFRC